MATTGEGYVVALANVKRIDGPVKRRPTTDSVLADKVVAFVAKRAVVGATIIGVQLHELVNEFSPEVDEGTIGVCLRHLKLNKHLAYDPKSRSWYVPTVQ